MIYYFVFKWFIQKFNVKTPGRDKNESNQASPDVKIEASELGVKIMEAVGGRNNISEIDNCISRLRLVLNDTSVVNEDLVKQTGSMGIIVIDNKNIQIVYGPRVEQAARALKDAVKR